ncbi:VTT domain-containing protein [uncultured Agrococcus sp.]|uniref:DedA family protein n=1 Tax=uncultured Agrococcus sp. TaxID=382258 RepID=UPI0025F8B892|nr:VTT domain-containing protein [uncultured Agrococcus sp.]
MEAWTDFIPMLTSSPWLLAVIIAVCIIDGFFPPVPSESTVVAALAAVIATGGTPFWIAAIVVVAAVGAIVGDSIAYALGRRVGVDRFAWMRGPKVRRTIEWITGRMHSTPAVLLLVGRYIPVGRVAVNSVAGVAGVRYRKFLLLSIMAGSFWAIMCLVIASASAAWLADPFWSAVFAVVFMMALGILIDFIARRRMRHAPASEQAQPPTPSVAPAPNCLKTGEMR